MGVQASSSRTGEITLGGMNVIGLKACHQHTGLQLFLGYIVKGSEEGFKHCKQFTGGCLEVSVYLDFCVFEFKEALLLSNSLLSVTLSCSNTCTPVDASIPVTLVPIAPL